MSKGRVFEEDVVFGNGVSSGWMDDWCAEMLYVVRRCVYDLCNGGIGVLSWGEEGYPR